MNIIFTGCSTGFGRAIYDWLRQEGHGVFGIGLNGPDCEADFADPHAPGWIPEVVGSAYDALGGEVDAVINNAGMTHIDFIQNHSVQDFETVLRVNLTIPFVITSEALYRNDQKYRPLRIINTSSMGTQIGLRASPAYVASKAGLEAMTKSLAKELAGVRPVILCAIAPGGIEDTKMSEYIVESLQRTRGMSEPEARAYSLQSPLKRNMRHEELLAIYKFALFDMPEYMTGTVLYCTGGMGV